VHAGARDIILLQFKKMRPGAADPSQKVMIDILNADLGFHPGERHSFQCQHCQGSGGVLGEGVIDSQAIDVPGLSMPSTRWELISFWPMF
jgi:hypothetical protein